LSERAAETWYSVGYGIFDEGVKEMRLENSGSQGEMPYVSGELAALKRFYLKDDNLSERVPPQLS